MSVCISLVTASSVTCTHWRQIFHISNIRPLDCKFAYLFALFVCCALPARAALPNFRHWIPRSCISIAIPVLMIEKSGAPELEPENIERVRLIASADERNASHVMPRVEQGGVKRGEWEVGGGWWGMGKSCPIDLKSITTSAIISMSLVEWRPSF